MEQKSTTPPLMTRKQLGQHLRDNGIPIADRTLDDLCKPSANGKGPPIAKWWGRRPLYDPTSGLAWANARMTLTRPEPAQVAS